MRPRRRRGPLALVAAAVVVAVAAGTWLSRGRSRERPSSTPREIPFTSEPGHESGGRFSPDGSTVVFNRFGRGRATLEAKVIGAESSQVLREEGFLSAFSPDGRWIAFYQVDDWKAPWKARLLVIPRTGGQERELATVVTPTNGDVNVSDRSVSWTPDGRWLATPDRDGGDVPLHIALVSVESGEKRRLTTPPQGTFGDSSAAVSPDGRTLVFTRYRVWGASDLYLLRLSEDHRPVGEPWPLTHDVPAANGATWTPDGREIIFCSRVAHAATLWRVAADGRTPPRPLGLGGRGAWLPDVDSTGTKLIYSKHVWDTNVWRVGLLPTGLAAGPPEPFLQSNHVDDAAAFSPDGTTVAFVSERSGTREVWLSDAQGGKLRQLTSLDSSWGMEPAWSPRGEWIAFEASVAGRKNDVYVVGPRGGVPRPLTSDPADDRNPSWSADGRRLLFESDRGGARRLWHVPLDGGEARLAADERPGVDDPAGVYRYFAEETADGWTIRRQRRGGGPAEAVVEGAAGSSLALSDRGMFALTERGIYFVGRGPYSLPNRILFLDLASRKTTKIVDLMPGTRSGGGLAVSPDRRTLLYTQCDAESDDLVLVENFR